MLIGLTACIRGENKSFITVILVEKSAFDILLENSEYIS